MAVAWEDSQREVHLDDLVVVVHTQVVGRRLAEGTLLDLAEVHSLE